MHPTVFPAIANATPQREQTAKPACTASGGNHRSGLTAVGSAVHFHFNDYAKGGDSSNTNHVLAQEIYTGRLVAAAGGGAGAGVVNKRHSAQETGVGLRCPAQVVDQASDWTDSSAWVTDVSLRHCHQVDSILMLGRGKNDKLAFFVGLPSRFYELLVFTRVWCPANCPSSNVLPLEGCT